MNSLLKFLVSFVLTACMILVARASFAASPEFEVALETFVADFGDRDECESTKALRQNHFKMEASSENPEIDCSEFEGEETLVEVTIGTVTPSGGDEPTEETGKTEQDRLKEMMEKPIPLMNASLIRFFPHKKEEIMKWTINLDLGVSYDVGSKEGIQGSWGLFIARPLGKGKISADLWGAYGPHEQQNGDFETQLRIYGDFDYERPLSKKLSLVATTSLYRDEMRGIDFGALIAAGVQYDLSKTIYVQALAGYGYENQWDDEERNRIPLIFVAGIDQPLLGNERTRFIAEVRFAPSLYDSLSGSFVSGDYRIGFEAGVIVPLTKRINGFLKAEYIYEKNPPRFIDRSDFWAKMGIEF